MFVDPNQSEVGKPIRVMLVDDHPLVRAGIRGLLKPHADITIVAEASGGHEALQLLASSTPDVMLLDISMPEMDGLEVAERVAERFPTVRVVILSAHTDVARIRRALKAGVVGYVSKDVGGDIAVAVRAAGAGAKFFSAQILERAKDSGATGTG